MQSSFARVNEARVLYGYTLDFTAIILPQRPATEDLQFRSAPGFAKSAITRGLRPVLWLHCGNGQSCGL